MTEPQLSPSGRPRPVPAVLLPGARRTAWGGVVSFLLHAAVVLAILVSQWQELMTWEEIRGPGDGNTSGGGGGGGLQMVALPALRSAPPPPAQVVPPPPPPVEPVPVPDPVVTVTEPEVPVETVFTRPDSVPPSGGQGGTGVGGGRGTGSGPGDGSGVGPGSGAGSGGGSGTGGGGGTATPPLPRQVILPPLDYPGSLRGKRFAVTFWVGTDGRVQKVAVEPDIPDGGFARRFEDVMRNYRFRPARTADGKTIPGTTTVNVSF